MGVRQVSAPGRPLLAPLGPSILYGSGEDPKLNILPCRGKRHRGGVPAYSAISNPPRKDWKYERDEVRKQLSAWKTAAKDMFGEEMAITTGSEMQPTITSYF